MRASTFSPTFSPTFTPSNYPSHFPSFPATPLPSSFSTMPTSVPTSFSATPTSFSSTPSSVPTSFPTVPTSFPTQRPTTVSPTVTPANCCNKTGYAPLDVGGCGCASGYTGSAEAGLCYSDLTGCAVEFKPGYIAATVVGTLALCVIFFCVCYFRVCRNKDDPHSGGRKRAIPKKGTPAAATSSVVLASPTSRDTPQFARGSLSNSLQPPSQVENSVLDVEGRRLSGHSTLPRNIQDILPSMRKGEGGQASVAAQSGGRVSSGGSSSSSSSSSVNVREEELKPPPFDPNHLPTFYGEVQYRSTKLLGKGNFGRAYLVTNERGKQLVIKTQFCPTRAKLEETNEEAKAIMQFKSEHLLEISDVFPEGSELCLAINFCSGGTLAEQVPIQNSVEEVIRMIKELSKGLAVLHGKDFIHRDIKPDNIFLADKETRRVVIGDMGLARKVGPDGYFHDSFGHTLYKAPEIAQAKFSWRSDMWAVGCVLLELLSHTTMMDLYNNQRLVLGIMKPGELAETIDTLIENLVGTSAWKLVHRLLVTDHEQRLTATEVVQWDLSRVG